jgi:hypothetical protein
MYPVVTSTAHNKKGGKWKIKPVGDQQLVTV